MANVEQVVDAEVYGQSDPRTVCLSSPLSAAAEQYRLLALKLDEAGRAGRRRIAITSAVAGEGRTLTAVNTALALGQVRSTRVALVDADLRSPGTHRALGLMPQAGLVDVVTGETPLSSTLWRFGDGELWVLPASRPDRTGPPHLILGSRRLGVVMDELLERVDLILIDAPPILPTADLMTLAQNVDALVLVIRAGRTSRELITMALDAVSGLPLLGVVLVGIAEEAGATWQLCADHDQRIKAALALPPRRR